MDKPTSSGHWWFKGQWYKTRYSMTEPSISWPVPKQIEILGWGPADTTLFYFKKEFPSSVFYGDAEVLLCDLVGTWEKAQMPSWEAEGAREVENGN